MENPLLGYFGTKYESAPFTKIVPKHFIPAIEKDIQESLEAIDKITNQTSQPSFDNTIDALQNIGEFLERNSALLFNLNSAETTEEIQKITQQASPILTKFHNDVRLNQALFERIKTVLKTEKMKTLQLSNWPFLKRSLKVLPEMVHYFRKIKKIF